MNVAIANSKTDAVLNSNLSRSATTTNCQSKPPMKFGSQKVALTANSNHSLQRLKIKKAAPVDNQKQQVVAQKISQKYQAEKTSKLQTYQLASNRDLAVTLSSGRVLNKTSLLKYSETTAHITEQSTREKSLPDTQMRSVWNSSLQSPTQTQDETHQVQKKKSKLILKNFIQPFVPGLSLQQNGCIQFDQTGPSTEMPSALFKKAAPDSPSVLSNDNNSVSREASGNRNIQENQTAFSQKRELSQPKRAASEMLFCDKKHMEARPNSPPSGNPFKQFLNDTTIKQPLRTSLLRDQLLNIRHKSQKKIQSSRHTRDLAQVKRTNSALQNRTCLENVIQSRMAKRFKEIQDKYNNLIRHNSENSASGDISQRNDFEPKYAERLSRSTGRVVKQKRNENDYFAVERNPTRLRHQAIKTMVRLDIKRPQTSTQFRLQQGSPRQTSRVLVSTDRQKLLDTQKKVAYLSKTRKPPEGRETAQNLLGINTNANKMTLSPCEMQRRTALLTNNKKQDIESLTTPRELAMTPQTLNQLSKITYENKALTPKLQREKSREKLQKEKAKQLIDKNKKRIMYKGKPIVINPTTPREKLQKYEDDLVVSRRKINIMRGLQQPSKPTPDKQSEKASSSAKDFNLQTFYQKLKGQNPETVRDLSMIPLVGSDNQEQKTNKTPFQQVAIQSNRAGSADKLKISFKVAAEAIANTDSENLKYSFKETPCFRAFVQNQEKKSISPSKQSNKKKSGNILGSSGFNLSFGETFSSANQTALNEKIQQSKLASFR